MFSRVKNAVYNVVGGFESIPSAKEKEPAGRDRFPSLKFRYTRPSFLQLTTDDEISVSADHVIRPIIVPRDITKLPWNSGYAETVNAGKSARNEDQGAIFRGLLRRRIVFDDKNNCQTAAAPSAEGDRLTPPPGQRRSPSVSSQEDAAFSTPPSTPETTRKKVLVQTLPWVYLALFDGHAGSGVAVATSNTLHKIIHDKFVSVLDLLLPVLSETGDDKQKIPLNAYIDSGDKRISVDSIVIGTLESAFWQMDSVIARDKLKYTMSGGCTALVAVFILGKLYLANAGDSRATVCRGDKVVPMSFDFTPESERVRIKHLAQVRPELLGNDFTHLEFLRRPTKSDVGKKMLYRDSYMSGWTYKIVSQEDLKVPLISGEGKKCRMLATIGVSRGFGDHDLKAQCTSVPIKPFLTPQPEVRVFNLAAEELTDGDVLVMATDGLWDVTQNEKVAEIVQNTFGNFPANDLQRYKYRYTSAAQNLVMHARGELMQQRGWRTVANKPASVDDISVFVIPLKPYREEHLAWQHSYYGTRP